MASSVSDASVELSKIFEKKGINNDIDKNIMRWQLNARCVTAQSLRIELTRKLEYSARQLYDHKILLLAYLKRLLN